MKILIYSKDYNLVRESGVGKAIDHQIKALKLVGADFTLDEKDDFDIVHINTVMPASFLFAEKAKMNNKGVIYHAHSTKEDFKNSFLFSNQLAPSFKMWLVACYNKGDLILTPSEYSKKLLEEYKIKRPIEVVSNGIDLDFWKEKERDRNRFYVKYGLDKKKKSIISVGLFIRRKGIIDFVELAKRLPQYEFVWFGKLDLKVVPEEVRAAVTTKLDNLHFPGYVNSDKLREAYCGSDLYIFPTYEETEGIVLLEALACKTDIIVKDIEIYKKDFEDGVNIYKAKDVDEFEKKIVRFLDGDLKSLKDKGYEVAEDRSILKTGEKLMKYYKEVYDNMENKL